MGLSDIPFWGRVANELANFGARPMMATFTKSEGGGTVSARSCATPMVEPGTDGKPSSFKATLTASPLRIGWTGAL